jgi:hypothetical protein
LGINLPDVISGQVSAARALWLLEQIGEGSALWAAASGGPEYRAWTTPVRIAAFSLNALHGANWQRGGGKGSKPKPIEPPEPKGTGAEPARKKGASSLQRRIAQQAALRRVHTEVAPPAAPSTTTQD